MRPCLERRAALPRFLWIGLSVSALTVACGTEEPNDSNKDSGGESAADTSAVVDSAGGDDAVQDIGARGVDVAPVDVSSGCTTDDDCSGATSRCDQLTNACVQCLTRLDCKGAGDVCVGHACGTPIVCKSDKQCSAANAICDKKSGACVDCLSNDDCGDGVCKLGSCVAKGKACKSTKECAKLAQVCDKKAGECVDCTGDDDCEDERFCQVGLCLPDVCKGGAKSCKSPAEAQVCRANGGGYDVTACTAKQACDAGACKDKVCEPKKNLCIGIEIATCNELGTSVVNKKKCPASQTCKDGACVAQVCTPGATKCGKTTTKPATDAALSCAANGLSWQTKACADGTGGGVKQSCAVDKKGKAACANHVCTPKSVFCGGDKVEQCADNGLSAKVLDDCGKMKGGPGKCHGAMCLPGTCKPGLKTCAGDVLATCNKKGDGYDAAACKKGQMCQGGACVAVSCIPDKAFCNGFSQMQCNATGDGAKLLQDCAKASLACESGKCIPLVCKPGAATCSLTGKAIATCKADGLGSVEIPCGAKQICVKAKCADVICVPKTTYCDKQTIKTCSLNGTAAVKVKDCAAGTICLKGACIKTICKPGASKCTGPAAFEACVDEGLKWQKKTCAKGTGCVNGECLPQKCKPGSLSCVPPAGGKLTTTKVRECSANGLGYKVIVDCGAKKLFCVQGSCKTQLCPAGKKLCVGGKVKQCSADGLSFVNEQACADGNLCTTDGCKDGACVFGAPKPCKDANDCTIDACNGLTGKCTHTPTQALCDDGDKCTIGETCATGSCKPGNLMFVSTFSGNGGAGWKTGSAAESRYYYPRGLDVASNGTVYVPAYQSHRVRIVASDGSSDDWYGSGSGGYTDGAQKSARFNAPHDVALGVGEKFLYVADYGNNRVRKIDLMQKTVSLLAGSGGSSGTDGVGAQASIYRPIAIDAAPGGIIVPTLRHKIRLITTGGLVTTLAGSHAGYLDGPAAQARFNYPYGVAWGPGATVYVADHNNRRIRKIAGGVVTTVAGNGQAGAVDGPALSAAIRNPAGLAIVGDGLIFADFGSHSIRKLSGGKVTTIAGSNGAKGFKDGFGSNARFYYPWGIAIDPAGNIFVGDRNNHRIRKLTPSVKTCNDANPCTADVCDKKTAKCSNTPIKVGQACNDGNLCTNFEKCDKAGKCTTKTVKTCFDGNQCTKDVCDPVTAKCSNPQHTDSCNDGNGCTVGDVCEGGKCLAGKGILSTYAGTGLSGLPINGDAKQARFYRPFGIATVAGGIVYVGDSSSNVIRKIDAKQQVTTFAGTISGFVDGAANQARFKYPTGLDATADGVVYVADTNNHRIRRVGPGGWVTTWAGSGTAGYLDGPAAQAQFNYPYGVAVDSTGAVFVADRSNNRVRRIDAKGVVATVAGSGSASYLDGAASSAAFNQPLGLVVAANGTIYVAEGKNSRIRAISKGIVSTIAGAGTGFQDGPGTSARFSGPHGIALGPFGALYVADRGNHRIRRIDMKSATRPVSTVAGTGTASDSDGQAAKSKIYYPGAIAFNEHGELYVATYSSKIRKLVVGQKFCNDVSPCTTDSCNAKTGKCAFQALKAGTKCNDGSACTTGDACDAAGKCASKAKSCNDGNICTLDWCDRFTATCHNDPADLPCDDGSKCTTGERCHEGKCKVLRGWISTVAGTGQHGYADGKAKSAQFKTPAGIAFEKGGGMVIGDAGNNRIRRLHNGVVSTVAGSGTKGYLDGPGASAQFNGPYALGLRSDGTIIVADTNNFRFRAVSTKGQVTTLAGSGGKGFQDGFPTSAKIGTVQGMAVAPDGGIVYADSLNNRIRAVSAKDNSVTTLAGSGNAGWQDGPVSSAAFRTPRGVALAGASIFVADRGNHRIRRIRAGLVTTVAGSGAAGSSDGKGPTASFNQPSALALNKVGDLYVFDGSNFSLRVVEPDGTVRTLAGNKKSAIVDGFGPGASFGWSFGIALDAAGNLFVADSLHAIRRMTEPSVLCADGKLCTADVCNAKTGTCSYPNIKDGGGCSDPNKPCLKQMTCKTGTCQGGKDLACDDGNTCTLDSCEAKTGVCSYKPNLPAGCKIKRRVFVTSKKFDGKLGGLAGADAKCQAAADGAKLGGQWKAWLSTNQSPAYRFNKSSVGYQRIDGKSVAATWQGLVDGNIDVPIKLDENGKTVTGDKNGIYCKGGWPARVWTNTRQNGLYQVSSNHYSYNCRYWTYTSSSTGHRGFIGDALRTNKGWTETGCREPCKLTARLYCFEQTDHYYK